MSWEDPTQQCQTDMDTLAWRLNRYCISEDEKEQDGHGAETRRESYASGVCI